MQPVLPAKCIKLAHQLRAAQLEKPYATRSLWQQAIETLILIVDQLVLLAAVLPRGHLHVGIVGLVGPEPRANHICDSSHLFDKSAGRARV